MGSGPDAAFDTTLVVFGASGDLARRKVLPALQAACASGQVQGRVGVLGAGRSNLDDGGFQALLGEDEQTAALAPSARWVRLDYGDPSGYRRIADLVSGCRQVVYYLATPPEVFPVIVDSLAAAGLNRRGDATRRVVVEKPLGRDLATSRELNRRLDTGFEEAQIYRIDHYLAKDTVQN
ncbi:MAG: glucose-6-phosphate dehydrogenase, partial [Candidatus Dormiibacterota bacterium]